MCKFITVYSSNKFVALYCLFLSSRPQNQEMLAMIIESLNRNENLDLSADISTPKMKVMTIIFLSINLKSEFYSYGEL